MTPAEMGEEAARAKKAKAAGMNMTMIAETMNIEAPKANRRGAWNAAVFDSVKNTTTPRRTSTAQLAK